MYDRYFYFLLFLVLVIWIIVFYCKFAREEFFIKYVIPTLVVFVYLALYSLYVFIFYGRLTDYILLF